MTEESNMEMTLQLLVVLTLDVMDISLSSNLLAHCGNANNKGVAWRSR